MPSRKIEHFTPDALTIGERYSRPEVAAAGRVKGLADAREWGGLVEFSNEIHIYVTLHKTRNDPQHMYNDRIEGDVLFWDSRATHTTDSLQVRKLLADDKPVRLFCRLNDREHFVYCGELEHISHAGSKPVAFRWRLRHHGRIALHPAFVRLAMWIPPGHAEEPVDEQPLIPPERSFQEGAAVQVTVNRYERDPQARAACIAHHGCACWVCKFDFLGAYGSLGAEFCYVHHRRSLASRSAAGPHQVDPQRDLVPICGNCHAMVHRRIDSLPEEAVGFLDEGSWRRLLQLRAEVRHDEWDQP